jgi:hypothetical protein
MTARLADCVTLPSAASRALYRKGIPSNVINLNIGKNADLVLSNQFWMRLTNKLGNQPYVKENGIDVSILNTVQAITFCLQDQQCTDIPFTL